MSELDQKILALEQRLELLVRTQIDFQKEVSAIRSELTRLRRASAGTVERPPPASAGEDPRRSELGPPPATERPPKRDYVPPGDVPPPAFAAGGYGRATDTPPRESVFSRAVEGDTDSARSNFEKFIGENLISKLGIAVLVLGVGIGAKYAIDNELISPLTRIVIGYLFGFGLVGTAIKLKPKYHNFSAVLISGGMAIMYFVTFFAYSTYGLMSQISAFALMVMFTLFTVAAALLYSRQVIAHIGLVGAYAVPFLLSSDSGNHLALFSYMAIVNLGILAVSVKKRWVPIYYTSFAFTWVIFLAWIADRFVPEDHFRSAIVSLSVFFAIFFAAKAVQCRGLDETAADENRIGAVLNGVVYFLFCFAIARSAGAEMMWPFFTYLWAATAVILAVSFRYYRQVFVYICFPSVWLIFGTWFAGRYDPASDFYLAAVFTAAYFALFYVSLLYYRLVSESFSMVENATAVLSNAFIAYGLGYSIIDRAPALQPFLGLYTTANSAIHLVVAHAAARFRPAAVDVVHVLTILVLTFASIAVPVQFDGNFVTMIWCIEGALLFWYGRTYAIALFEKFSYPVMALAAGSMFLDWLVSYSQRTTLPSEFNPTPLANGDLVTAVVFVAGFAFIYYVNRFDEFPHPFDEGLRKPFGLTIGALTLFVVYNALRIEIGNYHHIRAASARAAEGEGLARVLTDLFSLNVVWQIDFTMAFLAVLGAVNLVKLRSRAVSLPTIALATLSLGAFSTVAMVLFYQLRESYMHSSGQGGGEVLYIAIRYVSYATAALLLGVLNRYSTDSELTDIAPRSVRIVAFDALAYSVAFIALSCELVNVMGQIHIPDATKLGLSILWGVSALFMIIAGIARERRHLRFAAFALLGVTLIKLFLYDIADLDTIPKTILFVTLGLTLLLISFLYNKYKDQIFGAADNRADP